MPQNNIAIENKPQVKPTGRFLSGVAVLTASTVIVKLIGLLYKIPMLRVLGEEGMGYFNSAYELYTFFYIIATAGLPVAISIMIAKSIERNRVENVKKIYKVVLALFILIGMVGTVVLYYGSAFFGAVIGNTNAVLCIAAIAPMAIYISVSSAVRGFFQGYQNMIPTAISQVIEAAGKLLLGLALAIWAFKSGYGIAECAAFATAGIAIGSFISMVYLLISKYLFRQTQSAGSADTSTDTSKSLLRELFRIAVPITLSSLVVSLTRVIDLVMIMRRLQSIGYTMNAANSIYGSYSTLATSMFNLPLAFVPPIAIALVPVLTSVIQNKNAKREHRVLNSSFRLCALITLPASFGLSLFSRPILELIFAGENSAINVSAPLLSVLAISVFFSGLMTVTNSVLQAYGMEKKPIVSMAIGAAVKAALSYVLIGIPKINIYGAPISTFACVMTVFLINLRYIRKATGELESATYLFLKPLLASVVSIGACGIVYYLMVSIIGKSQLLTVLTVGSAAVLYGLCALKMKAIESDDILLLPKGEKIEKLLRKVKLL